MILLETADFSFVKDYGMILILLCLLVFLAILFLQSGLDKVTDRRGNLEWLTGHFEKSPLKGMVPLLLTVITLMEMISGILSAASAILLLFIDEPGFTLPFYAGLASTISLLMLFFGQRMAKDYAGAATLVPYFLVSFVTMAVSFAISLP